MTSFEGVYLREPPGLQQHLSGEFIVAAVADERQLKFNLDRAKKRMVAAANKKRRDLEFKEGNLVFLKLRPYRQSTLVRRINQKLSAKYFGPFKIVKKVGAVAYQLELPPLAKIHPIFHVSLLKKVTGEHKAITELPPELIMEEEEFVPSEILSVAWEGKAREEAS